MRKSFAKNEGPMLIGVVRERTARDAIAAIKNCTVHGATGIDLHLSCLNEDVKNVAALKSIIDQCELPMLALNYNQTYEYESFETDEESRIALLMKYVEAGGSAVDLQGYTYDLDSKYHLREDAKKYDYSFLKAEDPHEIVVDPAVIAKQMALIDEIHEKGAEVLLSCHPLVPMTTEQVVDLALFLEKRNPDVIKIITRADNEEQLGEALKTMLVLKKEVKTKIHFHAAGKAGKLSRVLNPILGAYLIFCNDGYTASSNFEQPELSVVKNVIENMKKLR